MDKIIHHENGVKPICKKKTLFIFILTIILGYVLFIVPDIFFGITKFNSGKKGSNLLFIALFQFLSIVTLLHISLKILKKDFGDIGLKFVNLKRNILLGICFGALWTVLQFSFIIPRTGGANRLDIEGILTMYDGSILGTLSFIALGVIGGGITEELFNRGYFINLLRPVFKNPKLGLWISVILSIVMFSLGHMPVSVLDWFDILIPSTMYTVLFISTKRVTASIMAHGIYNMAAILLTYYVYLK